MPLWSPVLTSRTSSHGPAPCAHNEDRPCVRLMASLPRSALWPGVLVLLLLGSLVGLRGQQPPAQPQPPPIPAPPEQQRPTFRAGANLVRVDVSVVDHHGEPVADLTKDDFEVREDNVPQTVQTFKFMRASGQPSDDDDMSLPIRSPEHAAAEAARDDIRVFVIFWDDTTSRRCARPSRGARS